jgi:hypothetical protein
MVPALVCPIQLPLFPLLKALCSHINWHLEAGLAVVFGESPAANIAGPQSQIQQPDWKALCPTYDALAPEFQ